MSENVETLMSVNSHEGQIHKITEMVKTANIHELKIIVCFIRALLGTNNE